jgi:alpha-ketoglutarate-dependent taurine dioxygenase
MSDLQVREVTPAFGAEVMGFDPQIPLYPETCEFLRDQFDRRGLLLFPGLDIDYAHQVYLSKMLIDTDHLVDQSGADAAAIEDNFYISNRREKSAAPFGRLQFHSDAMWSDQPAEVLSLYGVEVEEPVVPTTFVSATQAWVTLPDELRQRVNDLSVMHTAGQLRRGDLSDVLVSTFQRAPSTVSPIAYRHPRTSETILYICEQMTQEIVGMPPEEGERLLEQLFEHMYAPASRLNHYWRKGDLVVWDNLAIQHARPNVLTDGPARTLRKFFSPVPQLSPDQLPTFTKAG